MGTFPFPGELRQTLCWVQWLRLVLSEGPTRLSSPEDENGFSLWNGFSLVIHNSGRWTKSRKPVSSCSQKPGSNLFNPCRKTPTDRLQKSFQTAFVGPLTFRVIFDSEIRIQILKHVSVLVWWSTSSKRIQFLILLCWVFACRDQLFSPTLFKNIILNERG
jgi:hypothetical protein